MKERYGFGKVIDSSFEQTIDRVTQELQLEAETRIGLLLNCNVVVRQDGAGKVHVDFMDPGAVLELVDRPDITPLASEVWQ